MTQQPPPPPYIAVDGATIRRLRQDLGHTIGSLAGRVGMSAGHLGQLERGNRRQMTPPLARRLAQALGVDTSQLRSDDAA
jgi:transcriptional regulator with XRE-family HTH domain